MAKLTSENRQWIINKYKEGKMTQEEIAKNSGVTAQAVNYILKTNLLTTPSEHKNKCLACGTKMRPRHWEAYKICGRDNCHQAYGEASVCRQHDGDKYILVQQHFWAPITDWAEIHYKGGGFDQRVKEYTLFHSQREHIGYHWEILEYGIYEIGREGRQVIRQTKFRPIWDGVDNYEGERKGYRPAPDYWGID